MPKPLFNAHGNLPDSLKNYPAKPVPGTDDTAVLVISCDAYSDLWTPFFHCFFKYWPDCPFPVYLGSNHKSYDHPAVRSILVGNDVDYSSNLLSMLDRIPQPWVILWIEDRLPAAAIDTSRILKLLRQVKTEGGVYFKLLSNHPYAPPQKGGREIGALPKGIRYRISMTVALWEKDTLKQILQAGESAWQFERQAGSRSDVINSKFFALTPGGSARPVIRDQHLIIKGHLTTSGKSFLICHGLSQSEVFQRPLEKLKTRLYVFFYQIFWELYYLLKNRCIPYRCRF